VLLRLGFPRRDDAAAPVRGTLKARLMEIDAHPARDMEWLVDAALDPATPIGELQNITETAKKLVGAAATRAHRDAATLLYHFAVASALANHGAMLTGRRPEEQRTIYTTLAATGGDKIVTDTMERAIRKLTELARDGR
jgi:hypothetical protein